MNKKLSTWEHEGWVNVKHRQVLRCLAAELKARKGLTLFQKTEPGYTARKATVSPIDFSVPNGTALPGTSLIENRQRSFYRGIREEKNRGITTRIATRKQLDLVKKSALDSLERHVSDGEIWMAARGKDILPRSAQFLWKSLHNAHKIGHYWTHIPECEDRAVCRECNAEESLDHILTKCASPGQEIVWREVEKLWTKKKGKWLTPFLGMILGSGLAEFRNDDSERDDGAERLYRILMSEAAYLIWRLRNERVIQRDGDPASEQEIVNRWNYHINYRLQVLETWSGTLDNEGSMPAKLVKGSQSFSG
ncbi:hypothetical protein B0H19DRAFT_1215011 [Mycena capillaripes]|nr:hypothetical protein B0H19DRAFT_1215011 [Mycena capillaripes]